MKKFIPWITVASFLFACVGWLAHSAFSAGSIRAEQARDHADLTEIMRVWRAVTELPAKVDKIDARENAFEITVGRDLAEQRQINQSLTESIKRQDELSRQMINTWNESAKELARNSQQLKDIENLLEKHMRMMGQAKP